jgi:hypothetical protein
MVTSMQATHDSGMARVATWICGCGALVGCSALAEPDAAPISTDRPGFLFAPSLVPEGRVQVEAGLPTLTVLRDAGDELRAWTLPVALRYGFDEQVELRASLPAWTDARDERGGSVTSDEGFGDAEIGAKLALAPLGSGPVALLASLRLPTGEDGFTTDELGGSAYLLHGRNLSERWWLQTMLGVTHVPVADGDDQTFGSLAALVSRPVVERVSGYFEATLLPGLEHTPGQSYLGGGLAWSPVDRVQLDLSADFGLDEDSADLIAALGVSWFL